MIALVQLRKVGRAGSGMPSSSQITAIGSGYAKVVTRSTRSCPATASSSSAAICSMRGRSASIRRRVNAPETSRRSRVWSGGFW